MSSLFAPLEIMQNVRKIRTLGVRRTLLATDREVLLAKLLLRVCDRLAEGDRDQEFIELYNSVKHLAEGVLR